LNKVIKLILAAESYHLCRHSNFWCLHAWWFYYCS